MNDINVLPVVWGEEEEQLVSWDPVVQKGPVTVPVPTPACQHQYQVFRKARTARIATNMATVVGRETSGQSFYSKVTTKDNSIEKLDLVKSVAIRTLPTVKRATVSVGNRFQKLQVPEMAMFGDSAFQKLQVPEMAMFGDSACGADPEVMPSGIRPVEQVLKSRGEEHITATPPTRTSIPPTLAPTSEAVKSQVVKDRPNLGSGIL